MRKLIGFFLKRKLLVNLTVVIVFISGLLSLSGIRREGIPSVEIPVMYITTIYPGAAPENVELKITIPLEDELYGIAGVDQISSVSSEGLSNIMVAFNENLSKSRYKVAKDEVQKALEKVMLPTEAKRPSTFEVKTESFPIIEVALYADDLENLRNYVHVLERKLLRTGHVSKIHRVGYPEKGITISVDPNSLIKTETAINDILRALQARNVRISGGTIKSFDNERSVVAIEEFNNPKQVENVIIRSNFSGNSLRLKDVAKVQEGYKSQTLLARANGKPGISLCIVKKEQSDIIKTIDAVKAVLQKEKVDYMLINDMSVYTRNRLNIVISNALVGILLVLIVLMTFMTFKTAFWTAFGIPFSFLLGFTLIARLDITLNVISLAGFLLVVGMLVDDAIVIAENIQRHRELGEDSEKAILNAVMEIIGPLSTTIATTIITFLPLLFISGLMGKFIFQMPAVVIILLIASYLESIFILPSHLAENKRRNKPTITKQPKKIITWLRQRYGKLLTVILKFRYLFVLVLTASLVGSIFFAVTKIPFLFAPKEGSTEFYIKLHAPKGSSLEKTTQLTKEIEKVVLTLPKNELESTSSRIGSDWELYWYEHGSNPNYAVVYVYLTSLEKRTRTMQEIIDDLKNQLKVFEKDFDEIIFKGGSNGPKSGAALEVKVLADQDGVRQTGVEKIKQFLKEFSGVYDIADDNEIGKDEIRIEFDYDKIARLGIGIESVASTLRMAYIGLDVTSIRQGYDNIVYTVQMNDNFRENVHNLLNLPIRNDRGQLIRLKNFAKLNYKKNSASSIIRYDRVKSTTITAEVDSQKTTGLKLKLAVEKYARELEVQHPGLFIEFQGEGKATQESLKDLLKLFLIAILGIYFLLILLFNSFLQPLLVMSAIPYSIISIVLAFALHQDPLTMQALIGFIGLSGVVVNDSLIMVSYINDNFKNFDQSLDFKQAVIEGAVTRLRPIILTTVTTVAGVLPMIYGWGGTDEYIKPSAMSLGYGLLGSTIITLFMVPCLLLISADIRKFITKIIFRKCAD